MKFILLLLLLSFIGCEKKEKIQKNTTFEPECTNEYSDPVTPTCTDEGVVACGTTPGKTAVKAYCIDSNDNILEKNTPTCGDDLSNHEPQCTLITQIGGIKLQKNSTLTPKCKERTSLNNPKYNDIRCKRDFTPACGTIPGSADSTVYCIDSDDNIQNTGQCDAADDATYIPVCEQV